jgi:hypothetical protein
MSRERSAGRRAVISEIQGQIRNEIHDCQPLCGKSRSNRSDGSTWLISRTVGTCVVNPMCMKRLAVNSRVRNDRTPAAASFRRKLLLALKFVLRLSGFPFTASAGLGSIRTCLAAFNDLQRLPSIESVDLK